MSKIWFFVTGLVFALASTSLTFAAPLQQPTQGRGDPVSSNNVSRTRVDYFNQQFGTSQGGLSSPQCSEQGWNHSDYSLVYCVSQNPQNAVAISPSGQRVPAPFAPASSTSGSFYGIVLPLDAYAQPGRWHIEYSSRTISASIRVRNNHFWHVRRTGNLVEAVVGGARRGERIMGITRAGSRELFTFSVWANAQGYVYINNFSFLPSDARLDTLSFYYESRDFLGPLTRYMNTNEARSVFNRNWVEPRPDAPRQISPAHGTVFNHYPRTTTLRWEPVIGAASYSVEVDCFHCCQTNRWCYDVDGDTRIARRIQSTGYTFDFVGAQPGRWRVWAVNSENQFGRSSPWFEFRYTR
ncbi:MAG: hypothetical protein K8J31_14885 [Anaerolineae bacterium]|nr:hypothetical protein [Anaerolineae bacterium]